MYLHEVAEEEASFTKEDMSKESADNFQSFELFDKKRIIASFNQNSFGRIKTKNVA